MHCLMLIMKPLQEARLLPLTFITWLGVHAGLFLIKVNWEGTAGTCCPLILLCVCRVLVDRADPRAAES